MLARLLRRGPPHPRRSISTTTSPQSGRYAHPDRTPRVHPPPKGRALAALSESSRYRGKTAHSPERLLGTLGAFDIPESKSTTILRKLPELVYYHPDRCLKPKLEFLRSSGFQGPVLADLLATNPRILVANLNRSIIPFITFIKEIVPAELFAISVDVLKGSGPLVASNCHPNVEVLKKHGMPEYGILKLIILRPLVLAVDTMRLDRVIGMVKGMGFVSNTVMFIQAVGIFSIMTDATVARRVELCKSLGWKEDEIFAAIRKQPMCMCISDGEIKRKMVFFKEVLGWDTLLVSKSPSVMMYSIEKRFKPRGAVLNFLMLKGLLKWNTGPWRFVIGEKAFRDKYVRRFEKKVAGVVEAYEGGRAFEGWEQGCPEKVWVK